MTDLLALEVEQLIDRVHRSLKRHEVEGGACQRVVLDVPDAWVLLAAWLEMRRRTSFGGKSVAAPQVIDHASDRMVRALAKGYIAFLVNEDMQLALHDLAMRTHPVLQPPSAPADGGRRET